LEILSTLRNLCDHDGTGVLSMVADDEVKLSDASVEPTQASLDAKPAQGETPAAKKLSARGKAKLTKKGGKKGATTKAVAKAHAKKGAQPKRPYPRSTLQDALRVPYALKDKNGGNPWPPSDIAAVLGVSPTTVSFFYLAAASRDFGLTEGGRDSALISLTEFGRDVIYAPNKEEEDARRREALLKVEIFRKVLDHFKGANLPEMQYLGNTLTRDFNLDPSFHEEFSRLFKENCEFLKIGAGFTSDQARSPAAGERRHDSTSTVVLAEPKTRTGLTCFVAMPFRERDANRPKGFFDEVLRALIAPAGREAGFEVVAASREGSDVIHATIVNQLLDAELVIADLTENNPNVLFELGMRIAEDKPIALIRAKGTPPIFDVDNMLRVFEYDPNLWSSTVQHDLPRLIDHIKGAWDSRTSGRTFMKILRERKLANG
jgi:hypothetical protein